MSKTCYSFMCLLWMPPSFSHGEGILSLRFSFSLCSWFGFCYQEKLNNFCFFYYYYIGVLSKKNRCHLSSFFFSFSPNLRVKKVSRCVVFIMSFFIWLLWNDQIIMIKKSSILDFALAFSYFLTTVFLKKIWTGIWKN